MIYLNRNYVLLLILLCLSCKNITNKSTIEGLETEANKLNCENIFYINKKSKKTNSFFYGEKLVMSFENLKGFSEKEGQIFPGLQLLVLDRNKDTVLFNKDIYSDEIEGYESSDFQLSTTITLADPMKSKAGYKVYTHLWDKNGDGFYNTKSKIVILPNKEIKIKNSGFNFDEVYVYSDKRDEVILNKRVLINENIYFIIEGLDGFETEDNNVSLGASMSVIDLNGRKIFDQIDLFKNQKEIKISDLNERLSPYVIFSEKESGDVKVIFRIKVWDKKNENKTLILSTNLILVDEI